MPLGKGGMGIVYQAADRLTGQQVAFKRVLTPAEQPRDVTGSDSADPRLVLAQEFQILASLRHPNIIGVLDYGFDAERQPYFTMELLRHPKTIAKAGFRQPLDTQTDLLVQLLRALVYLHQRQILHRDLKPNNVLVEQDTVKVVDFGLSIDRQFSMDQSPSEAGTLPYLAPEIIRQELPSVASDLYAIGVITYEIFAGKLPFDSNNYIELTKQILIRPPDIDALALNPALAQVLARLLAKSPDARYSSAAEVIQALHTATGQTLELETEATRESFLQASKFIGRHSEMAQLSEALHRAIEGTGNTYLIGGESGVGKSRLFHELKTQAQVRGVVVLSGQAITGSATPYQLWQDFLRWLAILVDLSDAEASVLKPLVPDIAGLVGHEIADAPAMDPSSAQERLRKTVGDILERQPQPLLMIVEDLQWAQEQDLTLLSYLNKLTPHLPLLIVGNFRDEEQPALPRQLPDMQNIKLNRLSEAEIAALSRSMLGDAGHQAPVIDLLVNQTEGNVFFLVEVVRALAEEVGQLDRVGSNTLPSRVFTGGIQQIVQRRLDQVAPTHRYLLQIAAVAGRQIDLAMMRMLVADSELERWLVACAAVAVIEVDNTRWRFVHDKLREGVLLALKDERRRELNRTVARAIESAYRDTASQSARLAYHWGMADDLEAEARYALIAAEISHRFHARQEAAAFYTQAIDALAKLPDSIEHSRRRVDAMINRTEISLTIFDPNVHLQRLAEAEKISQTLPSPNGESGGDRRRLAHVQLWIGNTLFAQNRLVEAIDYYRQVLTVGQEFQDEELLAQPRAVLGRALGVQGRYTQAEPLLAQAIAPLAKLGHWHQWMITMVVLGLVKAGQGHCTEGLDLFPDIVERARALTDYLALVLCYTTPCAIHLTMRQDYDLAAKTIYELISLIENIKDPTANHMAYGYAMWVESRRGNHQIAAELRAKMQDIADRAGTTLLLNDTFVYAEAELTFNVGKFNEALPLAIKALETAEAAGSLLNQVRVHRLIAQIIDQLNPSAWDEIESHLTTSLSLSEANEMRLEAANTHLIWGQLLKDRSTRATTLEHWNKAAAQFTISGMTSRLVELQQQINDLNGL